MISVTQSTTEKTENFSLILLYERVYNLPAKGNIVSVAVFSLEN